MRNFIAKAKVLEGFEYKDNSKNTLYIDDDPDGNFDFVSDVNTSIFSPVYLRVNNIVSYSRIQIYTNLKGPSYQTEGKNNLIFATNRTLVGGNVRVYYNQGVDSPVYYYPTCEEAKDGWYICTCDLNDTANSNLPSGDDKKIDVIIFDYIDTVDSPVYLDNVVFFEGNDNWKLSEYFDGTYQPINIKNVQEKKSFKNRSIGTRGVFNGSSNLELRLQVISMKPLIFEDDLYVVSYDNKFHTIAIKSVSTTHNINTYEYNISAVVV